MIVIMIKVKILVMMEPKQQQGRPQDGKTVLELVEGMKKH